MITLNYNGTTKNVDELDSSYLYRAMMYTDDVTLYFVLPEFVDFPIGTYATVLGQTYTLEQPAKFVKNGNRKWEYTLVLRGPYFKANKYKFYNPADHRLKFEISASTSQLLEMVVANLNDRDSGWTAGDCISADPKLVEFNHTSVMDALKAIAEAFDTEYHFNGKEVILGKVEYNTASPLALTYGTSLRPGVGRDNYDATLAVERLYVQGGEKNIDPTRYGNKTLLLPKNKTITYEGVTYASDEDGTYIERYGLVPATHNEDSLDCSDRFPQRVGVVSSVVAVNPERNFYDIVDNTIPQSLNYNDNTIAGQQMTIIFQDGMLAGREFEVKYYHTAVGQQAARRFELVPIEEDGQTFPNATYAPAVTDKYIVFGVQVPNAYIEDDDNQTGAAYDMFRDAARYLYEHENPQYSYTGSLDPIWAKTNWATISSKIKLGGMTNLTDANFLPGGALIRIVGIKNYLTDPQAVEIEISNKVCGTGSIGSELRKIDSNEVLTDVKDSQIVSMTKRRFRDAKETAQALAEAIGSLGDQYTEGITPITARMMQLVVGDQALQYQFINGQGEVVSDSFVYDPQTKALSWSAANIKHMTLGIDTVKASGQQYKTWSVSAGTSGVLTDASKRYYIYLRCEKTGSAATVSIREDTLSLEDATYYNLLFGILNSEFEEDRSIARLYGFTEILPGQIAAHKFSSPDGNQYLDFLNKIFRVGDASHYMAWNLNNDGKMRIKGSIIVSPDGEESPLVCDRGAWISGTSRAYFGDVWTFGGQTWRCIKATALTPATAVTTDPVEGVDWSLYAAKGTDGSDGDDGYNVATITLYQRAASAPSAPNSNANYSFESDTLSFEEEVPGWTRALPADNGQPLWLTSVRVYSRSTDVEILASEWSAVVKMVEDGAQGTEGRILRGPTTWVSGFAYQGLDDGVSYVDYVYYNDDITHMYVCKKSTSSQPPTNTEYWTQTTVQEFVATKVLFAALAYVENLGVNVLKIAKSGTTFGAFMPPNTSGENNGDMMLWAGDATPANAPFRVDRYGKIWAEQGEFAGFVRMPFYELETEYYDIAPLTADRSYYAIKYKRLDTDYGNHWWERTPWTSLPQPSEELNGFAFNLIIPERMEALTQLDLNWVQWCGLVVYVPSTESGWDSKIINASVLADKSNPANVREKIKWKAVRLFPGFAQFVCNGEDWILTHCSGRANFNNDGGEVWHEYKLRMTIDDVEQ